MADEPEVTEKTHEDELKELEGSVRPQDDPPSSPTGGVGE
jgi:hypothetical protein